MLQAVASLTCVCAAREPPASLRGSMKIHDMTTQTEAIVESQAEGDSALGVDSGLEERSLPSEEAHQESPYFRASGSSSVCKFAAAQYFSEREVRAATK